MSKTLTFRLLGYVYKRLVTKGSWAKIALDMPYLYT